MLRYTSIKQVLNANLLELQILVYDVDWFASQKTEIVNWSESLLYCYFVCFQSTNHKFELFDNKFATTRDDDYKID